MRRVMSVFLTILIGLAVLFAGFALWVRLAPSDPARWHVDPLTAPTPGTPNYDRQDRVVAMPVAEVAAYIAAQAQAEGAVRLAGDDRFGTWIARTRLMA